MPIFEYKAYAEGGATRTGVIDADSPREARNRLRREKLLVSDLREVRGRGKRKSSKSSTSAEGGESSSSSKPRRESMLSKAMDKRRQNMNGASGRDLELVAGITRQLGTLIGAGIPLSEALKAVIDQAESRRIETLFRELRERITQGSSLGDAMAEHPELFSDLYVNMLRAGEATGQVDTVLTRLADFLQSQRALQRKIVSAMTYPALMISLGLVVVSVLMAFVVPKITSMLEDTGQELPLPTQILMVISGVFQNYWWLGALMIAGISYAVQRFYRTKRGRLVLDKFMLSTPFFGELLRKSAVARFARTLSTLLSSGVAAVQALEITGNVIGNQVIANATADMRVKILEGADIATPLKASGVFPPMVGYMVSVGEQSGELEVMLDRIADAYDEEVEVVSERVLSILEPIMIVLLAGVVGYIVVSIILPILQVGAIQ